MKTFGEFKGTSAMKQYKGKPVPGFGSRATKLQAKLQKKNVPNKDTAIRKPHGR